MITNIEPYIQSSPLFFTERSAADAETERIDISPPSGYQVHQGDYWTNFTVGSYGDLPYQGWKIHVSSIESQVLEAINRASKYCFQNSIPFKHVRSVDAYLFANRKGGDRTSAGKLITIYPDEGNLEKTIGDLVGIMEGIAGPTILTDIRLGTSVVHARYGVFRWPSVSEKRLYEGGLPGLVSPDGTIVEDVRKPNIHTPRWVRTPDIVQKLSEESEFKAPFIVDAAIRFSVAGGLYTGRISIGGSERKCYIKEGRKYAGLDSHGQDGFLRVSKESSILKTALGSKSGVRESYYPEVYWTGVMGDSKYVCMESIEGMNLQKWISVNMPLYAEEIGGWDSYIEQVFVVFTRIEEMISKMHEAGVAHNDIQPTNIIIGPENRPSLIDFETSTAGTAVDIFSPDSSLVTPGYSPRLPTMNSRRRDSYERDWLAILICIHQATCARVEVNELDPEFSSRLFGSFIRGLRRDRLISSEIAEQLDALARRIRRKSNAQEERSHEHGSLDTMGQLIPTGNLDLGKICDEVGCFPTHFDAYAGSGTSGLAFGIAGSALIDRKSAACPTIGDKILRTVSDARSVDRRNLDSVGIFNGSSGAVLSAMSLGMIEPRDALDIMLRHWELLETYRPESVRVYDGRHGILLAAIEISKFSGCPAPGWVYEATSQLSRDMLRARDSTRGTTPVKSNRMVDQTSGLLFGPLGTAWTMAEAAVNLGSAIPESDVLEALQLELGTYVMEDPEVGLQHKQVSRLLPYLSTGSAGFGVVLPLVLEAFGRIPDEISDVTHHLLQACKPRLSVNVSLMNGYSGLCIGAMGLASLVPGESLDYGALLDRSISELAFDVTNGGDKAVPSDSNVRVSMDLATGTPGVKLAARMVADGNVDVLHQLMCFRSEK